MPISRAIQPTSRLIGYHFSGHFSADDIIDAAEIMLRALTQDHGITGRTDSICLFSADCDLSGLNPDSLKHVNARLNTLYKEYSVTRGRNACVIGGSNEARIIMPLWSAIRKADPETGVETEIFEEMSEALAWLGIDADADGLFDEAPPA
ncbi:MAG: hypothetical protein ACFE0S_14500 [Rhodospirillales bacterium]